MGEEIARWLSEYPALINKVKGNKELQKFLEKRPVPPIMERVSDDTWHEITQKLQE